MAPRYPSSRRGTRGLVRVHGPRVAPIQTKARCSSTEPERAAIGLEATPEGGVSISARWGLRLARGGREVLSRKRFDANSPRRVGPQQVGQIDLRPAVNPTDARNTSAPS